MFSLKDGAPLRTRCCERLLVEPWGTDALRVRSTMHSVPFAISSLGYGFLWNNPAIGYVSFGKNLTEWTAYSTRQLDYWITAARTPRRIVENYAKVTGTVPTMPEYGLGLWQSKLRYRTQDELLSVAREYWRRGVRLDVIVVDFFHWPNKHGTPLMRPLCYDFPDDEHVWQIEDAYMFGPDILVAPVMHEGMRERTVYLPVGCKWRNHGSGEIIEGGRTIVADAPLTQIPVFLREGSPVSELLISGNKGMAAAERR